MHTDQHGFSEADHAYIAEALGRRPHSVMGVAYRDRAGNPAVIANRPFDVVSEKWIPFPTLYWLIDPRLNQQIAEIERTGGVRQIESLLEADEALMQQHLQDNRDYANARWALLSSEEQQIAQNQGMVEVLQHAGVGGVANHRSVKCLHAQYAYHLARRETGTAVGRLLEERLPIRIEREQ